MHGAFEAAGWGLLAGAALVLGAAVGYALRVPRDVIAGVMAFGAGVLLSAVSFELFAEAHERGGIGPVVLGALCGAVLFAGGDALLARRGARHRKRSQHQQPSEESHEGSGGAIALGALLDGIPESAVIGISLLAGAGVSTATVVAVFLSNVPEGLSSASGMRRAGRSARYIFGLWGSIAAAGAASAAIGFGIGDSLSPTALAAVMALAGGAILTMIADTMIPEAFEETHLVTGLITVIGFLAAFALSAATWPS